MTSPIRVLPVYSRVYFSPWPNPNIELRMWFEKSGTSQMRLSIYVDELLNFAWYV